MVQGLFNARDASLILSLPLSNSGHSDIWRWSYEKSEDYSVRSAHHLLIQ